MPKHVPILVCAILSLMTHPAHGQAPVTTKTTTLNFGGVINCQAIQLVVARIDGAQTETSVDFSIKECEPGQTVPTKFVAFFHSVIANQDFTLGTGVAKLLTASPYGPLTIDWAIQKDLTSSYDATWRTFATHRKQTQHDEFFAATATGTIGSYQVGQRIGQFSTSVFVDHAN